MAANSAWGIDVGNRALKAIKLVRDGDGVRVDDFEVIEHETVLSNAGDNREALIQQALASFVQRHQFKGSGVGIGVSGQSSFARFIKLPPVEPKKIPEIVRFEAIQQIPFPLDDVEWSYQLFQSPDSPDVEVGIFAMRKELVNSHISQFTDADLNVQVVQMSPLSVYNAMYFDNRLKGTTMIIDLGAENTDLIIADADTIWMRSIPIGGNNFTEALVKSFKLNFQKAEELKRNAASSKYARQIFQAMRPIFADLVAEVQRSIGFYASVHRDSRIQKIIALGGTFKLPGLQKYLQQNLQLEVERLDSVGGGSPADPKAAATFNENILSMVTAYGLALQAMGEGKINSSLLPGRIRRERMWQEKTKWFGAAAALFVLGTGVGFASWFVHKVQYDGQAEERSRLASVQAQASTLDTEWGSIESSGAADRQRIVNVRSLTNYRDLWPQLLGDLNAALPQAGQSPEELKNTERKQRKQILLDSVTSRYASDVTHIINDPDFKRYAGEGALPMAAAGGGMPMGPGGMDPSAMGEMMGMGYAAMYGGGYGGPPGMGAAPAAAAAPAAGPDTPHGFVVTVKGVTPYTAGDSSDFIDKTMVTALKSLSEDKLPPGKKYYIAKAEIVSAKPLRDNTQKLQQLVTQHQAAVTAKQTGQITAGAGGYGAAYGGGGYEPSDGYGMGGMAMGGYGGGPPPGYGGPPPGIPGMGGYGGPPPGYGGPPAGYGGAAAPGGQPAQEDTRPYQDRAYNNEDIRDDWEFTVVFLVVMDPKPKDPNAAPAAPAAAAAATPGAPGQS